MRTTIAASLAVIAISLSIIAGVQLTSAQPATKEAEQPEEATNKDATAGIAQVRLAHDLAKWGRDNKHPGAVAVASAILNDVPVTVAPELAKAMTGKCKPSEAQPSGAAELLGEAKDMVKGDTLGEKTMEALAEMGMRGKGASKGAIITQATIGGHWVAEDGKTYYGNGSLVAKFKKGELAAVWVGGDGTGEIDLYIYDAEGNLVTSDESAGDSCWCDWTPKKEAEYTILIMNRNEGDTDVALVTN